MARPGIVIGTQLFLLAAYGGSVAARTLVRRRVVTLFEAVQTLAALAVGLGGAVAVAHTTGHGGNRDRRRQRGPRRRGLRGGVRMLAIPTRAPHELPFLRGARSRADTDRLRRTVSRHSARRGFGWPSRADSLAWTSIRATRLS